MRYSSAYCSCYASMRMIIKEFQQNSFESLPRRPPHPTLSPQSGHHIPLRCGSSGRAEGGVWGESIVKWI